ncbi:MAG: hypothetical protein ACE37B_10050 [Ilumatobacter sp.]|jgi:hypothetical protein|uniref:hypothetical protein n=1 Tax=Ilumatobacter sp. TaxID=1967498 RepID=UPI00391A1225
MMSAADRLADVIPLAGRVAPTVESLGNTVSRTAAGTMADVVARAGSTVSEQVGGAIGSVADVAATSIREVTRRLTDEPVDATDEWGRDPVLVRNMLIAARLRWDVSTGGDQRLPKRNGALIVVNSPRWSLASIFAAFAVSEAVDRPVRFVGRPDDDLFGAMAKRLGGLLHHPDEVAGALRASELVVLAARPTRNPRTVGPIDHTIVGSAILAGVKVFPAATTSNPFARGARVEIGNPTRPPASRRGPLAELELADRLRVDITSLLSSMGDISTGTPLDWLPLSQIGAR